VQQATSFTINGEVKLPRDGQIQIPLLRLPSAERETGAVAVEVLGAAEIKDHKESGVVEGEAAELGTLISSRQSPSLIAFRFQPAEGKSPRSVTVGVARYTPQSVLTANIEEAAYNVLIAQDGKMLVESRLAVRNNQRNFLKVNLPSSAILWSASVAGRPIRPGRASDGSLLLPLEKTRSSEESPAFAVDIVYIDRVQALGEKGRERVSLLTLDMPISRSRMLVHHSPLFRLTAAPGMFRSGTYEAPQSPLLKAGPDQAPESAATDAARGDKSLADATQALVSHLKEKARASGPARNLPIRVGFPHFGPSIFLIAELTGENQTPLVELDYQRDKRRGEK
jgi:hypothetical protein